jgi:HEAT repeats
MFNLLKGLLGGEESPPINLDTASPAYRYFHEMFIQHKGDPRDGFDYDRIAAMTDDERAIAEPILLKSLNKLALRDQSMMALGALKIQASAEPIRKILKGAGKNEAALRIQAALALWQIEQDAGAFQIVKDMLKDSNSQARIEAVVALGNIKSAAAKELLLEVFAKDPEYLVRYNAARYYMMVQGIHFMEASNRVSEFMPFLRNPANLSAEEQAATVEKLRHISAG